MSVQQFPDDDLRHFLKVSKNAIADLRGSDWYWTINGIDYPEPQALKLAEYCMITGQSLTSIATIEAALNLARRTAAAEAGIAQLNRVITELKDDQHWHWWRRRRG